MTSDPAAVDIVNPEGRSPYVLLCEHASNYIPESYGKLGLGDGDLQRHIAWDIGAAMVARRLSGLLDAPLVLSGYSRLLIDCNRPIASPTSIPEISEETVIPGNAGISDEERRYRAQTFYVPFQAAVSMVLDRRKSGGVPAKVVGVHSFTPVFKGVSRPWHAGVLFRHSRKLGIGLVESLTSFGCPVAANQPYQIGDLSDYTVPVHGEKRGLDAVLFEVRQDLIAERTGAEGWAERLAAAMRAVLPD